MARDLPLPGASILLRQLGLPALRWRREITRLVMFHKLLHSPPEPLSEWLFQYASATSARSRGKPFQLLLLQTRTTRYTESSYRSALLWNSLLYRTTYNHSRVVNHSAMLSRTTTNHINLPQQKTFTYHSSLPLDLGLGFMTNKNCHKNRGAAEVFMSSFYLP